LLNDERRDHGFGARWTLNWRRGHGERPGRS
jgi:hypothetical protein